MRDTGKGGYGKPRNGRGKGYFSGTSTRELSKSLVYSKHLSNVAKFS